VALTTEERRRLHELAGDLARDNPRLARALVGWWHSPRARRWRRIRSELPLRPRLHLADWIAVICIIGAVPLLAVGAALAQPVLIGIGAASVVNGPALFTAARLRRSGGPPGT
jgi:hypothetical protein